MMARLALLLGLLLLAACGSPQDWAKVHPGANAFQPASFGGSGAGY
jgi:uncharacterized lipoprotein YajG